MSRSVLVVDDDASFRDLAARVLAGWGHAVVGEAGSVEEALARARRAAARRGARRHRAARRRRLRPGAAAARAAVAARASSSSRPTPTARTRRPRGAPGRAASCRRTSCPAARCGSSSRDDDGDATTPARCGWRSARTTCCCARASPGILTDAGLDVVAQAGDADDLLRRTLAHRPDVAIVDVQMPPRREDDGLVAALELRRRLPETGVLILSQFCEPAFALELDRRSPRGRRLPAQGARRRRRDVRRRRHARRGRRQRARPRGRRPDARASGRRRSAARADAARARRARRDGRGQVEPRHRADAVRQRGRRREARHRDLPQARDRAREHRAPPRPRRPDLPAGPAGRR